MALDPGFGIKEKQLAAAISDLEFQHFCIPDLSTSTVMARLTSARFQAGSTLMAKSKKVKSPGASLRKMLSTAPAPNAKSVKQSVKPFKMKAKRS